MRMCKTQGCGVCLNCKCNSNMTYGDICIRDAEVMLDIFKEMMCRELTEEQKDILQDFSDTELNGNYDWLEKLRSDTQ